MDLKALWNRYKEGSKAIDDLKAAMTVTKNDKKEFTIDGQSENCRGYHVTLPKDALIRFAKTTREFFLNDETLKQDVVRYLELAGDASSIVCSGRGRRERGSGGTAEGTLGAGGKRCWTIW